MRPFAALGEDLCLQKSAELCSGPEMQIEMHIITSVGCNVLLRN